MGPQCGKSLGNQEAGYGFRMVWKSFENKAVMSALHKDCHLLIAGSLCVVNLLAYPAPARTRSCCGHNVLYCTVVYNPVLRFQCYFFATSVCCESLGAPSTREDQKLLRRLVGALRRGCDRGGRGPRVVAGHPVLLPQLVPAAQLPPGSRHESRPARGRASRISRAQSPASHHSDTVTICYKATAAGRMCGPCGPTTARRSSLKPTSPRTSPTTSRAQSPASLHSDKCLREAQGHVHCTVHYIVCYNILWHILTLRVLYCILLFILCAHGFPWDFLQCIH